MGPEQPASEGQKQVWERGGGAGNALWEEGWLEGESVPKLLVALVFCRILEHVAQATK